MAARGALEKEEPRMCGIIMEEAKELKHVPEKKKTDPEKVLKPGACAVHDSARTGVGADDRWCGTACREGDFRFPERYRQQ